MKRLLVLLGLLVSAHALAANPFDDQITTCNRGSYELHLKGKLSLFDDRTILLKKSGRTLLDENYKLLKMHFFERLRLYGPDPDEVKPILRYAYRTRPDSITYGDDHVLGVSRGAIVLKTRPFFGDLSEEPESIIVQLLPGENFLLFDVPSDCRTTFY
jgi:hypothetical protein